MVKIGISYWLTRKILSESFVLGCVDRTLHCVFWMTCCQSSFRAWLISPMMFAPLRLYHCYLLSMPSSYLCLTEYVVICLF